MKKMVEWIMAPVRSYGGNTCYVVAIKMLHAAALKIT